MKWIEAPSIEPWPDNKLDVAPAGTEMGDVTYCARGHQWWSTVNSPDRCPIDNTGVYVQDVSPFEWWLHLVVRFLVGHKVYTIRDYAEEMANAKG